MHEHTDKPCKHDLKVCTECGNVYCTKCNKEWFQTQQFYYAYHGQPYTITAAKYTHGAVSVVIGDPVKTTQTHVHMS